MAKKLTSEQGRGLSPLTNRQEGKDDSLLTNIERRGYRSQATIEDGRGYRTQNKTQKKDKSNLGGNKLKNYSLSSRCPSKTESWKKQIAVFCHDQLERMP